MPPRGEFVRELSAGDKGRVSSVAFSPTDHRMLAVGYGGGTDVSYVALWDIDAGTELARLPGATDLPNFRVDEHIGEVGVLRFSPDGKYLVAGFGSKNMLMGGSFSTPLKVWEVATRRLIRRLNGHMNYCVSLDFLRDGTLMASGSRDGTAILWSTATWKATRTLQNPDKDSVHGQGRQGMVEDVAFSPDGKTLAMASREANVHLWDVDAGKLLETLKGHSSAVLAVAFSPDGRTLASGSVDQTVRLWNVETRRELMQLDPGGVELGQVQSLAFSHDGQQLLAAGDRTAFWSTTTILWNDPDRAAEKLRMLLKSNADFPSRIRMLSENLRLHEALAKLDAKDRRVQAALAATQANWHASRKAWPEAVAAFDRLVAADPSGTDTWLRTPGLLRLATALLHQNRPVNAAMLLQGGANRRAHDGLPAAVDKLGVGFAYEEAEGTQSVRDRAAAWVPGSQFKEPCSGRHPRESERHRVDQGIHSQTRRAARGRSRNEGPTHGATRRERKTGRDRANQRAIRQRSGNRRTVVSATGSRQGTALKRAARRRLARVACRARRPVVRLEGPGRRLYRRH